MNSCIFCKVVIHLRNPLAAPIPSTPIPNTNNIRLLATEDPLVCISESMGENLLFQPHYFQQGLPGATAKMYVRKSVADMLQCAARNLPEGYKLKILDAWRPPAVQSALFCEYYDRIRSCFTTAEKTDEQIREMAQLFVSFPSEDPNTPFVHATGGAVDLTVVDASGNELDMGTAFDDFSDKAHTAYFETAPFSPVRDNRRILYNAMIRAGFTNYPAEWWHYDYGNAFWAALNDTNAIYQGIYTEPAL